jgi:hypothetical protein
MTNERQKELKDLICKHLANAPDALRLIVSYTKYVHFIDDMIDGDIPRSHPNILKLCNIAAEVHANPFFCQFASVLLVADSVVNSIYLVCIDWEKSEEEWQKRHADVLRHAGLQFFLSVLYIVAGYDALVEIAPLMYEYSHSLHLNDLFNYGTNKQT